MNQEIKEKWVAALRSGEYNQAKEYLHTQDGFCCLGVLCDLKDAEDWSKREVQLHDGTSKTVYQVDSSFEVLPDSITIWAGLNLCDPLVQPSHGLPKEALSKLNDDGLTFLEIADLIEAQL